MINGLIGVRLQASCQLGNCQSDLILVDELPRRVEKMCVCVCTWKAIKAAAHTRGGAVSIYKRGCARSGCEALSAPKGVSGRVRLDTYLARNNLINHTSTCLFTIVYTCQDETRRPNTVNPSPGIRLRRRGGRTFIQIAMCALLIRQAGRCSGRLPRARRRDDYVLTNCSQ